MDDLCFDGDNEILSDEASLRPLRARVRGRGRGRIARAKAARARAHRVEPILPNVSQIDRLTTPGAAYDVEYFGGSRVGRFRPLTFSHTIDHLVYFYTVSPQPEIRSYLANLIGRVNPRNPDPAGPSS